MKKITWTNWTVRADFPTPPEPSITILYSRILEILADLFAQFFSFSTPMNWMFFECLLLLLWDDKRWFTNFTSQQTCYFFFYSFMYFSSCFTCCWWPTQFFLEAPKSLFGFVQSLHALPETIERIHKTQEEKQRGIC